MTSFLSKLPATCVVTNRVVVRDVQCPTSTIKLNISRSFGKMVKYGDHPHAFCTVVHDAL